MLRTLGLVAAFALAATAANAAACKNPATGKFIKCPAASASAPAATSSYTLDVKGRCHDASGKMAKKAMCAGQTASTTTTTTTPTRPAAPAATGAATTTTMTRASSSTGGPHCTKGKRCGNACISVKDVCHK